MDSSDDPSLDEVATFVEVVEAGSMAAAAARLRVPRSTVSRRVARLEAQLGLTLLKRTTRRMSLTDEGRAYFGRVSPAVDAVREAGRMARDRVGEPSGTLRITAPVDFGQAVLGPVVAAFVARFPRVKVDVDLSNRSVDLVQEGFDLAIRAGPMPDSSLVARKLVTTDICLFASPAYLTARGTPAHPRELAAHTCVRFRSASARWRLSGGEGGPVDVDVDGPVSTTEFAFLRALLVAGGGIGLLPIPVALDDLAAGRLARVLAPWAVRGSPVHIVTPTGRYLPAKVRAFRDLLVDMLTPAPWEAPPDEGDAQTTEDLDGEKRP